MTPGRLRRATAALLVLPALLTGLSGCWDNREIDEQYILTGVALDMGDRPGKISTAVQVANIQQGDSGSQKAGGVSGKEETIVMKATGDSLLSCFMELNRESDRELLFHHNRIRLFGIELAREGVDKHLDLLMRDQQARLEVPLVVVDGRGEDALTAKLLQAPISSVFLGGMLGDLAEVSEKYRVRLIDFTHRLLDGVAAPVLPIIKVTGEEEKREIRLDGMAVFHGGKMIGRMTNDEMQAYVWTFGDVRKDSINIADGADRAVLQVAKLDCKRKITLRQDGGVRVALTIRAEMKVGEVYGFEKWEFRDLLRHLEELAQKEIRDRITACVTTAQHMDADVFEFCTAVYKKYPKRWGDMKDRWAELFRDLELDVQATVRIPANGQIVQSVEMEESAR